MGLLCSIEFALARRSLLLRRRVCIARIENFLFRQPGIVTRLFELAVFHTGAILTLSQCSAVIFNRRGCRIRR